MSYFKDLRVCYYTNTIYNDQLDAINAEMDESYNQPIIDNANNYVCAIERLEVSSNALPFYDVQSDPEAKTSIVHGQTTKYVTISMFDSGEDDASFGTLKWNLYGTYFSLQHLIDDLNEYTLNFYYTTFDGIKQQAIYFSLDAGGCICVQILNSFINASITGFNFAFSKFIFSSSILASIFGLPKPIITNRLIESTLDYYTKYSQYDGSGEYLKFKTRTSRIDAGNIPAIIQVRTSLPLESDQINTAKFNIATDFSLTQASSVSTSYTLDKNTPVTDVPEITPKLSYINKVNGMGWNFNVGGMILYQPNERRWLNFNSSSPIFNIRIWIEYVTQDGTIAKVKLPYGCKFSIKLGFYQKENAMAY